MKIPNIHEGKADKPQIEIPTVNSPKAHKEKRLGFMVGNISVPDDFDRMGETEIERLFGIGSSSTSCSIEGSR
ncbi:hypothetical protein [Leminorella grimontii]|uniref:hypothetical protein n=1 Tax=Leminorella grimontii TaxID=82981 RepID=UPI0020880F7D|nr:hypothetical protein [Leminorella grimontii]GKX58544.1 hypothetical protein SOASR031_08590 [Leminorella grimontii]